MAVEELRQRRAAQADHERLARLRVHEQERHHAARVVERERMRIVDAHRALDRLAADVQGPHAARVAHGDGGLRLRGQRRRFLAFGFGLATRAAPPPPTAATTSTSSRRSGCTRLVTPTSVLAGICPGFRYPARVSRKAATLSALRFTM